VQSKDSKQARGIGQTDIEGHQLIPSMIDKACGSAFTVYRALVEKGVPREIARLCCPWRPTATCSPPSIS
jgi:hypothetical protein